MICFCCCWETNKIMGDYMFSFTEAENKIARLSSLNQVKPFLNSASKNVCNSSN